MGEHQKPPIDPTRFPFESVPGHLKELVAEASKLFRTRTDTSPVYAAWAPGRVNLIGEHTDYNGGFVLPLAIEQSTVALAAPATDGRWTIASTSQTGELILDRGQGLQPTRPEWASYVFGVVTLFQQEYGECQPLDVLIHTNLPIGAGVSSSAALELAVLRLLERASGVRMDPPAGASLCQRAEHLFAGVPCGIMDQYVVTFGRKGHALLIDCQALTHETIPLPAERVGVMLIHSGQGRSLREGTYALRRDECTRAARGLGHRSLRQVRTTVLNRIGDGLDPILSKRVRHVASENDRTKQAADALRAGDFALLGQLMNRSHASLRDDFEVSTPALDALVSTLQTLPGVLGCRLTGGGMGGCAIALIDPDGRSSAHAHLQEASLMSATVAASDGAQ